MRRKTEILSLLLLVGTTALSQQRPLTTDPQLEQQIVRTGLIHSPLPLDHARSYEANIQKKKVLQREALFSGLRMAYPTFTGKRIEGYPSDPDYGTYEGGAIRLQPTITNWENFNRIAFSVYPDCEGARVVNLDFAIFNEASVHKPGYNRQSGSHLVNLVNKQWNHCFLDIDEYQRDHIAQLVFSSSGKGKDRTTGDSLIYYIDNIELQQVETPEIVSGWLPRADKIVYSTTGYMPDAPKTAIVNLSDLHRQQGFELIDAQSEQVAYQGNIRKEKTSIGTFHTIDFSAFNREGYFKLKVGAIETPAFRIGNHLWDNSLWRVLNFIFCQRCGHPVPGIHGTCHTDLCAIHDGKKISYAGGWHDAGDLSQQTLQTGDVTYALLEAYNKLKGSNEMLAARLLEEAEWGIEFMLRTRFGDGYRASSVGLLIWLDGIFNTLDDINTVRVQNLAFDNFLYAGYEAYAALTIDRDPRLQEYLTRIAKEDFEFALQRHREKGYGEFIHFYEHSYNTSESQYMATISWSAAMLYKLTGEQKYADCAAEYIRFTLDCQRKEPLKDKDRTRGFFYRDQSRRSIVHYIHQSREQVYMQALTLLCEVLPEHPDYAQWEQSIRLYGDYLKGLMKYTAPYSMLSSGVYHLDEHRDSTSFYSLHLFPPENAETLYVEQVKKGVKLDKEHYLKRFPVWFSIFNGNSAIHLSTGKAAALCGKFLKDEELLQIGLEQLYWTVGKNPFGQSIIYGEGHNYPQMDSFSSGEITGEMPVGIRSLGNEDVPYWPQTNAACYKEVWVTTAGKWLLLATEY